MFKSQVEQYAAGELPQELAVQVESFVRLVWASDRKDASRFWHVSEITDPMQHFVISERGVLISHALVRQRSLMHGGKRYMLYGVGAVMTYPAFRGEGYARRVVDAATVYIHSSDADAGTLFTYPALESFYSISGWVPLENHGITHGDASAPTLNDAFTMMLFVSDKAKANRASFDHCPLYVGDSMW